MNYDYGVPGYLVIINWILDLASFLQFQNIRATTCSNVSTNERSSSAMAGAERIFAILREEPSWWRNGLLDQRDPKQWYWVDGDKRIPVVEISNYTHFGYARYAYFKKISM